MHILSPETWQLPFLNQRKGENDRRKYFMINLHKECCRPRWGLNPLPPGLQSEGASNWATEAGRYSFELQWQVNAIQMGTHNTCLYKGDKNYTGCNPKTTELLECALIGVCAVINSKYGICPLTTCYCIYPKFLNKKKKVWRYLGTATIMDLIELRFYGPVNLLGSFQASQLT